MKIVVGLIAFALVMVFFIRIVLSFKYYGKWVERPTSLISYLAPDWWLISTLLVWLCIQIMD